MVLYMCLKGIVMNLSGMNLSFAGILSPYTDLQGRKITPISKDPTEEDVNQAIESTKVSQDKKMEGMNGYVFLLGQDLVVKKYKGKDALSDNPYREIKKLDRMYDSSFQLNNSQKGLYAIEDNSNTYLVSTKVEGENPDSDYSHYNENNLKSLVGIIEQMDKGMIIPNSSKKGHSNRIRFMNYDFNGKNIHITPNSAGLFDFEYSVFENIDDMIEDKIVKNNAGVNPHQSDTSNLPSSLKSFEFYAFSYYLQSADNTREVLTDYLDSKGQYHENMSKFYKDFTLESDYPEICMEISKREQAHSKLLKKDEKGKIPQDILMSEARKIQMAQFLHEQSPFCSDGKIPAEQIKEYSSNTLEFFKQNLEKAEKNYDKDRIIYYTDCYNLMSNWINVNKIIENNIEKNDKVTLSKLTTDHKTTIDELIG